MGKKAKRRLFYGGSVTAVCLLAGVYMVAGSASAGATSIPDPSPRWSAAR